MFHFSAKVGKNLWKLWMMENFGKSWKKVVDLVDRSTTSITYFQLLRMSRENLSFLYMYGEVEKKVWKLFTGDAR